jgi:eukaryotic-like serine/threonine-protein kinase
MPPNPPDDEAVMNAVQAALARPADERDRFLQSTCAHDLELYRQARNYVEWETRMQGFLLDPLFSVSDVEHPFHPGDILEGRFRIVREIAQGGMGVVYEAYDQKLERRIALKCSKAGFANRLSPEVRHATEITHPNVCKMFEIHSTLTADGSIDFVTMEFLEGETLTERLAGGALPQAEAVTIARQLCAGLAEAHRNHVIHGDLKSSNVILTRLPDGAVRAVITDFGLARGAEIAHAAPGAGTPDYMAPELWNGGSPTIASDIYAFGVVLHELAYGRRPPLAPHSPHQKRWDRILEQCLDQNPQRRFMSAAEIAEILAPRRRSWLVGIAAAALVAAVTGWVAYSRAAGPKETWRLAMLPIEPAFEAVAADLTRDTARELARLKGGKTARLTVIPLDRVERTHIDTTDRARSSLRLTHMLGASLTRNGNKLVVHAILTDIRSGINGREWTAEYAPSEVRYVPRALASVVTSQLNLSPLAPARINETAGRDYWSGLWYLRRNSTVDSALPLLERAVSEDRDSPLAYAALAEAQQWKWFVTKQQVWLDRAHESWREAERRNPDVEQVQRVACLLDLREGAYEDAERSCLRAIALDSTDGEAHRLLGQSYEATNRLDESLAEYKKSVQADSKDYRNYQQLGTFYFRRAEYDVALPHFRKAVELAPDEPAAIFALGGDYFSLGRLSDAESELRRVIRLGETSEELLMLGAVLLEKGNYADAAPTFSRALQLQPEQVLGWMNLGTIYRLMNRRAESLQAYRSALRLAEKQLPRDPRNAQLRSRLAYLSARLGDSGRAESEIGQARMQSPSDATVHFMAAATFEALNRRTDTLRFLSTFSNAELADVNRWPDLADLSRDPRFLQLLASRQTQKEKTPNEDRVPDRVGR